MKNLIATLGLIAGLAACQPDAEITSPAITTDETVAERQAGAPVLGATSFTEEQAQRHLVNKGYLDPTNLKLSEDGTWRGEAVRGDQTVNIVVDYQGNVSVD